MRIAIVVVLMVVVVVVVGIPLLIYSFVMFDRLVRAEYEFYRTAWESDGKPGGFFWKAPECTFFRSGLAINKLSFKWLFITPSWILQRPPCQVWLTRMRVCVLGWHLMLLSLLFLALLSS